MFTSVYTRDFMSFTSLCAWDGWSVLENAHVETSNTASG